MKWNDFTKWLQKSSAEYESQVDVNELWSSMESGVDAINGRGGLRNTILAVFLAGILIAGGIILYEQLKPSEDYASAIEPTTTNEKIEIFENAHDENAEAGISTEQLTSEAREEDMKDQLSINNVSSSDLSNASSFAKDNNEKPYVEAMNLDLVEQVNGQVAGGEAKFRDHTGSDLTGSDQEISSIEPVSIDPELQSSTFEQAGTELPVQSENIVFVDDDPAGYSDEMMRPQEAGYGEDLLTEETISDAANETSAGEVVDAAAASVEDIKMDIEEDVKGSFTSTNVDVPVQDADVASGDADETILPDNNDLAVVDNAADVSEDLTIDQSESDAVSGEVLASARPIGDKKKKKLCPNIGNYKGKKWTYLAGVEAGAAYPFQKMTSSGTEGDALFTFRDERESSIARINYGLAFSAIHPSGFSISSGFGFATLLERYEYQGTKVETEMVYGVQSIAINPLGDTIYTMGDIPVTTTTQVNKKIYNKYNYFEIPILIGYQRKVEDWSFGVQGGVSLGLITSAVGQISDENGDDVSIFDLRDELFRTKFSPNYYLGGKITYQTKGGLSIYVSPHVRFAPHDVSADSYPVSSKYTFVGGNIGVAYKFGR